MQDRVKDLVARYALHPGLGMTRDAYLGSIAGYRPNRPADLAAPLRDRIAAEWGRTFDEWGYAR